MNSKIQNDINNLVKEQVISKETALNIEAYYNSKKLHSSNRLFTVFGVIGSLLIGLGVILILAHNWDNFSKSIKTFFAFLPLVTGQIVVGYSIVKNKSRTWKEASGVFLFFAVGACISLISQIYNIPGKFSTYLLTWVVLCLPLIYLLKSYALSLLHLIFITYYACEYGYSFFNHHQPWYYLVLLALALPFYLQLLKQKPLANITSILNWFFPLSLTISLGTFVNDGDQLGFLMYVLFFGLMYIIGTLPFFNTQKLRKNGFLVIGSLGMVITLLTLSFWGIWKLSFSRSLFEYEELYFSISLFVLSLLILVYMKNKGWIKKFNLFQYVFVLFPIIFFIGFSNQIVSTVLVNLLLLALGLTYIKKGVDRIHFGILNYGLVIISALIACRFFDPDISFENRGLLFVAIGLGFFITNYIMLKKQRAKQKLIKK